MKKESKKDAVFNYLRENPNAKNKDVAKACGVHPTYASLIRRNAGVKKPKGTVVKKAEPVYKMTKNEALMLQRINDLASENRELKDDIVRLCGVIEYLEQKLEHATSV